MSNELIQTQISSTIQNAFATRGVALMNAANARVSAENAVKRERLNSLTAEQKAGMTREQLSAFVNGR